VSRLERLRKLRWKRILIAMALVIAPALVFPRWWCGRGAGALFQGRLDAQAPLAREVARWVDSGVSQQDFNTGSARFDGEWQFGTHQMAALGLAQVVLAHPETKDEYVPVIERCFERLLSAKVREFEKQAWNGKGALESLDGPAGHAAYLGYFNLALGVYRQAAPETKHKELHDKITAALARRIEASPTLLLETYPGETYPVDNTAVIASVAQHARATGRPPPAIVRAWVERCRAHYVDPVSGLLYQSVDGRSGAASDKPRASGTALGAYFLSFADRELSRDLFEALRKSCAGSFMGFGFVCEYPANVEAGWGDIDSGPVIFNLSFSGTGFALAGCRIHGDRRLYRALYTSACLVGSPLRRGGRRSFVCGGPLGNAIMLAMLTAGEGG